MFQDVFNFFVNTIASDGDVIYSPTLAGNIALFILIVLMVVLVGAFSGFKRKTQTKQLVFSSVAIALAVVTSMYTIVKFPFGGSITFFRMFFICFIGYLYGPKVGIVTGIAYGFLDMILGPYIVHPIQLLLDYPLAFGSLGLAGVFSKSKHGMVKGYILGVSGRYICHLLSGIIFFASAAPEGQNVLFYSLGYNASYIVPEAIATILIISIPAFKNGLSEVKRMAIEE